MKHFLLVTAIATILLTGCETTPFQKSADPPVELLSDSPGNANVPLADPGLVPATARRFRDVPLPQDLREDTERSFVYDAKTIQVARMVYTSKKSLGELAQFYIKQAPENGWKLQSTTQVDDSVNLLFTKTGRRLDVSVSRQGVGRSNKLVLLYLPEDSAE